MGAGAEPGQVPIAFLVLTVIGTYFRGPNWAFYWSPSQWPKH